MNRTYIWLLAFILFFASVIMTINYFFSDDVSKHIQRGTDLSPNLLSWFEGLDKEDLQATEDINMQMNLDTNIYLITWKFQNEAEIQNFLESTEKKGFKRETFKCSDPHEECKKLEQSEGFIYRLKPPHCPYCYYWVHPTSLRALAKSEEGR